MPAALRQAIWLSGLADPAAVEAVALAEELNRPRWARRLERVLVPRAATYGLMQVRADRPLSDLESVELYLADLRAAGGYPALDDSHLHLRDFFLAHNDDTNFADLATRLYWEIRKDEPYVNAVAQVDADDGPRLRHQVPAAIVGAGLAGTAVAAFLLRRRKP